MMMSVCGFEMKSIKIEPIGENESIFLDMVRLVSAQMVFFGHLFSFMYGRDALIGGRVQIQNLGVVLFFMLSGYLICRTLFKYLSFRDFLIDRFARIHLTLLPCLLLIASMDWIVHGAAGYGYAAAYNLKTFVGNIFMLQDHIVLEGIRRGFGLGEPLLTSFGSARPLWTLAVEWWLYMLAGYLALVRHRNLLVTIGLCIIPVTFATIGRGEGLTLFWLLGGTLIFLPAHQGSCKYLSMAALGLLALYAARLSVSRNFYDLESAVYLAGIFALLLLSSRATKFLTKLPPGLKYAIRVMAGASYAYYILHYTVIEMFRLSGTRSAWIGPASFVFANGLAILVYFLFDRHHKKVGNFMRGFFPESRPTSGS